MSVETFKQAIGLVPERVTELLQANVETSTAETAHDEHKDALQTRRSITQKIKKAGESPLGEEAVKNVVAVGTLFAGKNKRMQGFIKGMKERITQGKKGREAILNVAEKGADVALTYYLTNKSIGLTLGSIALAKAVNTIFRSKDVKAAEVAATGRLLTAPLRLPGKLLKQKRYNRERKRMENIEAGAKKASKA
jgi:hypothetical protein